MQSILLVGNRRPSLTVIRSLHRVGWRIIVALNGKNDRNQYVSRSRFAAEVWEHRCYREDWSGFAEDLRGLLAKRSDIKAVFPIDEAAIRALLPISEILARSTMLVMANIDAVNACLHKPTMLDVCRRSGVPCAEHREVRGIEELEAAIESLGYPSIVKPLDSETLVFGVKAATIRNGEERAALLASAKLSDRRLMVQSFVDGPRHNVYFGAANGKILQAVEVRIQRTDRVDGTGLAVLGKTVSPTPVLQQDCLRLVKELGYHGVGCAQFLVPTDGGKRSFLELNPRLGANFAVVETAGLPLSAMAVGLAQGSVLKGPDDMWSYRRDLRFAWTGGDLAGIRFELRQGTISKLDALKQAVKAVTDGITADAHITWSWRDPLPTLLEFIRPFTHRPTTEPSASGTQVPNSNAA